MLKIFNKEKIERKRVAKEFAVTSTRYKEEMLKLDLKYGLITQQNYDFSMLEVAYLKDSVQYKNAEIDLWIKYHMIDEEQAEYKKIDILYNRDTAEYKLKKLELDLKFNKIDQCEYEVNKAKLTINDKRELDKEINEIKFKFHKIDENDYHKEKATIEKEPFVGMKSFKLEPTTRDGVKGYELVVEIDNNQEFLDWLRSIGYNQSNDDNNVKNFLNENLQEIVGEFIDEKEVDEMREFRQSDTIYVNETDEANTVSIVGDMKIKDDLGTK